MYKLDFCQPSPLPKNPLILDAFLGSPDILGRFFLKNEVRHFFIHDSNIIQKVRKN